MRNFRKWAVLLALTVLISGTLDVYAAINDELDESQELMEQFQPLEEEANDVLEAEMGGSEEAEAESALPVENTDPEKETESILSENTQGDAESESEPEPSDADSSLYGRKADAPFFTIVGPDGTGQSWNGTDAGAVTIYYNGVYDPEQTLTVTCREEFELSDPEGVLREISSGLEETVYAMTRPIWEQPCLFTVGGMVLPVYILLPVDLFTQIVVYDETWLPWFPELMVPLQYASLEPQQEIQFAILSEDENGDFILLSNPLDLIRSDRPLTVFAEPDTAYFTLIPQEGNLTLGIERGRKQSVWVSSNEQVDMYYRYTSEKTDSWYALRDGYSLKTRVAAEVRNSGFQTIGNGGSFVRSSDTGVIEIEVDEQDASVFYLLPVGFGESVISLDSDEYDFPPVTLVVAEGQISMLGTQQNPDFIGLPSGAMVWGPAVLPDIAVQGSQQAPFVLPCLTRVKIDWPLSHINMLSATETKGHFVSSDPSIVEVIQESGFEAYLNPVGSGTCIVTYREGPFVREVVVRSEPDALGTAGCVEPGFYTYYGTAHIRTASVSLKDGMPIVMAISLQTGTGEREALESTRFQFSSAGVARVELVGNDLFHLVPVGTGSTILTCTTREGNSFQLHISVGLPHPVWDFVILDDTEKLGYRLWNTEQIVVGDLLERQVFFAQVTLAADQSIHTVNLQDTPQDLTVDASDGASFDLVQRDGSLFLSIAPHTTGEYSLTITATPPGMSAPLTWEKRLKVSQPITVEENTVAAINQAIQSAPVDDGFETVILLPNGYIPMDSSIPILLNRPVTLRGQNTVLASDVVALHHTQGAKLQNLTIRFDDASLHDRGSRERYPFALPAQIEWGLKPVFAVMGDGIITLENCQLDGGTGSNQGQFGIGVDGARVTLQGSNTIRNFGTSGWVVHSMPGPRRYYRGLTFEGNETAVEVRDWGSVDPYFMRLSDSNFIGNNVNVRSDFPVNFSHNYFEGGADNEDIIKSPQYMKLLEPGEAYPNLFIEEDRLTSLELINFEGQTPIDTNNFETAGEPVKIIVRELDSAGVSQADSSQTLLQWSFSPAAQGEGAALFLPDAYIDEIFDIPPDSGIECYQGISFAHHGPLPMEGAQISVRKQVLFEEETLYLYRLTDGVLSAVGEVDNTGGEVYTFLLDRCSDYIITNVAVEDFKDNNGGGDENTGGSHGSGNSGNGADSSSTGNRESPAIPDDSLGNASSADPSDNAPADAISSPESLTHDRQADLGSADSVSSTAAPGISFPIYDYSTIPAPPVQSALPPKASSNHYVDDASIRAAFAHPRNGQVVVDVGVKTVITPLAFQLLAEDATLTLVLKGDGYEWRFSGADIRSQNTMLTFDSAVNWQVYRESGYARLNFAQQESLPGDCVLELEATVIFQDWGLYDIQQGGYASCVLNVQQQDNRLSIAIDSVREYVALL